jgi:uncharacterized protein VirK/YbjX
LLSRLTAQFVSDWSHYSPKAAAARLWRVRRVLPMSEVRRRLDANPACQRHMALVAPNDPVFFLSHRHYLVLWRHEFEGHAFDLRLMPGNDVLYEGGASLVLHQDGGRVAVLSYATVPSASFLHEPGAPDRVLFIARKQTGENHDYQKVFNKAFDRCTPWHLCVGALTGLALAQGLDRAVGIVAAVHPSRTPELEARLKVAYDDFWTSLGGRPASPFGLVFDLPMHLTPLDELDAKARKRAVARREHIQQVQDATQALIARHLRAPAQ